MPDDQLRTPTEVISSSVMLRRTMGLLLPALSRVAERFWSHPELRALYPQYLVALHTIVRASVPLMAQAHTVLCESYLDTPVGPPLAAYLAHHLPEETGHDDWLLEDIERLGLCRDLATRPAPSTTVATMVGSQYYYIHHYHPAVLLGYIAALEGYPPEIGLVGRAAQATGYPVEAFRTLRRHAHLDIHHRADFDAAFDAMPLDGDLLALIRANAVQTLDRLVRVMDELTGAV